MDSLVWNVVSIQFQGKIGGCITHYLWPHSTTLEEANSYRRTLKEMRGEADGVND